MTEAVGKNVRRLDGYDKVTGAAKYLDDMDIPDCWYASIVRSSIPYGKIRNITFDPSFDWKQVVTCDYKDIPGSNCTVFLTKDQPILAEEYVRHVGEAIVLIAAPTKDLANKAKDHVKVEYEELAPIFTIEESKKKNPVICNNDNIQSKYTIIKGDVQKGFKEADHIIEGEYKTGFHEHLYIEPNAMAAMPRKDGGITVLGGLQCPYYVLKTLKEVLGTDESGVNVRQITMGGAFGGKEDYPSLMGSYLAILTRKSEKPVKLVYSREEDIVVTTKRHPSIVTHKTGVKKDGTITAIEVNLDFDGGAYTTISPVVLSRGIIHSAGAYKCEHVLAKAACYATNKVPYGAYRGFGVPQAFYGLEMHIDKVAKNIGMNPYNLRMKNCVHVGDTLATTQLLKESVAAEECLVKATQASDFLNKWKKYSEENKSKKKIKKGIGLSFYMHGGAFTGSGESIMTTEVELILKNGGKVIILTGSTDMGQGSHTVLPQIAAQTLGISIDYVSCHEPDTAIVPDSGPTVASRTTMIVGTVVENCAKSIKDSLYNFVAERHAVEKETLNIKNSVIYSGNEQIADFKTVSDRYLEEAGALKVVKRYHLPPGIKWDAEKHLGDAYPCYSWATDVAEVTVDMETFEVSVDKMTLAVDVGKAVNPNLLEGNIEGGTLQALGWGIMEDSGFKNGRPINDRMQTYMIPTVKDTPEWNTIIVEEPFSAGPMGAKGVGELPTDGGAPAIANAIYNATGIRVTELPITPEKLFVLQGKTEK